MNTRFITPVLRVVLDANVLAYFALAKLLLRLARRNGLFLPYWSQQVLDETWRTYAVKLGHGTQYASARLAEIVTDFPDALQADLEPEIAQCTNDPKDRHVLAAAIKAEAGAIVTFNQKHFRPEHLEKWGIIAMNPNDLLLKLYAQNPDAVWQQLKFAAAKKQIHMRKLLENYSPQLARFKAALLADLP